MWVKPEKRPVDFSILKGVTLQDCNKNVVSRPRSCKLVDDRVEKEFQLLLARGRCC